MQDPNNPPQPNGMPASGTYGDVYSGTPGQAGGSYPPPAYGAQQNGYTQPPYTPSAPASQGLSDTAAGALAYITIIPAIVFLLLAPYNTRPFVKFHAIQCLGLAVAWFCLGVIGIIPLLGWIVVIVGSLALLAVWILSIVKASQGSYFKLPVISDFASQQSGYGISAV